MKKRMLSLLLMLAVMVSLSPAAFAAERGSAEDILGGGYICLTRNVHLENIVPLEQDTVLDLNGYTIDGDSISVPQGVTLFLKNGTMKGSVLPRQSRPLPPSLSSSSCPPTSPTSFPSPRPVRTPVQMASA